MRLTPEQAAAMGLLPAGGKTAIQKKRKDRRSLIKDAVDAIHAAKVSIKKDECGYTFLIVGEPVPSLNTVLRWDMQREFTTYNKAWCAVMRDAALEAGLHREKSQRLHKLYITAYRKRLLDYDNVCLKQIIDGCCKSGVIFDDDPRYISGVDTKQVKSKMDAILMRFEFVEPCVYIDNIEKVIADFTNQKKVGNGQTA